MDDGVTMMIIAGVETDIVCQNIEDYKKQNGNSETELAEVEAFYNEVGGNARLIITGCDITADNIKAKLAEHHGDVRILAVDGVADSQTIAMLQQVAEWSTDTLMAPIMVIAGATDALIESTASFQALGKDRVAIVDNVEDQQEVPLIYYVAARLASKPVQRSIGRVKDGALYPTELYSADGNPIDNLYAEDRHAKGLVTARIYVGKAGYFLSDDLMAEAPESDYALIPRRRTIDKAYRIAYRTLVNYIGDEIPVTDDGKIPTSICKEMENSVERQIELLMTNEGNLGIDPSDTNDTGVTCFVDPDQNVVSTSRINVVLKVKPYGYAKYIVVNLGFSTEA